MRRRQWRYRSGEVWKQIIGMQFNAGSRASQPRPLCSIFPPMDPLAELGARIASLRRARDLARAELARRAGLSERFLADVESGRGNIAFSRLLDLCAALEAPLSLLASDLEPSGARGGTAALRQSILESLRRASRAELEEARRWLEQRELARRAVVALVGLRGAGKTTLGRRVAARLRARFVELDER